MDSNVPRTFFQAMLSRGVREPDPLQKRLFIEPCVRSLGQRRVVQALLVPLEQGDTAEKGGAAIALYWASTM
jgi:hypothetical protein